MKPNNNIQICYNYKGLNTVIIKNWYPLPLVYKIFNALYGTKYFIKFNIIAVFNQIQIIKGHKWLTAFIIQFKIYKILITPLGLCNVPITFYIMPLMTTALHILMIFLFF